MRGGATVRLGGEPGGLPLLEDLLEPDSGHPSWCSATVFLHGISVGNLYHQIDPWTGLAAAGRSGREYLISQANRILLSINPTHFADLTYTYEIMANICKI
ncbi:hypothetical protein SAY87_023217 [Trapa incisa]|uniref:Uncharacterized protein n=1 Tax=Trapa incisa TaxID=236973 RepID=A0AAN7K8U5_9MYRT|nr:hypothetical protein SAY87_023217 [Trapa incisa]